MSQFWSKAVLSTAKVSLGLAASIIGLGMTSIAVNAETTDMMVGGPSVLAEILERSVNVQWKQIPGCAHEITAGKIGPYEFPSGSSDMLVVGCDAAANKDSRLYGKRNRYLGDVDQAFFTPLPKFGTKIGGENWHLGQNGSIRFQDRVQRGCAKEISVGTAGAWVLGCAATAGGFEIYRADLAYKESGGPFIFTFLDGVTDWELVPGGATKVAVGKDVWVINNAGQIFRYVGDRFQQVEGCATDIAANGSHVWVTGCGAMGDGGYDIYERKFGKWMKRPGSAKKVAVDHLGNPWIVTAGNAIYTWSRTALPTPPR
jgi:hypothetical protein